MLFPCSLRPEDVNPPLLPWAASGRAQPRELPILSSVPWPAPAPGKETSPGAWSERRELREGRGDVPAPKPGAAQSRADTAWFKRIKERFRAQERQGGGPVT